MDRWLATAGLDGAMILQVHDELVLEVADGDVDAVAEGVRARMAGAARLDVELVVDVGGGPNWDEAQAERSPQPLNFRVRPASHRSG